MESWNVQNFQTLAIRSSTLKNQGPVSEEEVEKDRLKDGNHTRSEARLHDIYTQVANSSACLRSYDDIVGVLAETQLRIVLEEVPLPIFSHDSPSWLVPRQNLGYSRNVDYFCSSQFRKPCIHMI